MVSGSGTWKIDSRAEVVGSRIGWEYHSEGLFLAIQRGVFDPEKPALGVAFPVAIDPNA